MTLAEFRDLCDREWANGRGDVLGLLLTDESYAELTAGAATEALVSPVTRSVVKVTGGASADCAEVRRYFATPHPAGRS